MTGLIERTKHSEFAIEIDPDYLTTDVKGEHPICILYVLTRERADDLYLTFVARDEHDEVIAEQDIMSRTEWAEWIAESNDLQETTRAFLVRPFNEIDWELDRLGWTVRKGQEIPFVIVLMYQLVDEVTLGIPRTVGDPLYPDEYHLIYELIPKPVVEPEPVGLKGLLSRLKGRKTG
jgi:hypothetical protein